MTRDQMPDGTVLERDDDGEILGVFSEPVDVLEHRQRRREPVQDGPRCAIPRPTARPPAGPPVEPVTRVDNATWGRWEAERQKHIAARRPAPRDARRAVAVALSAEYSDLHTASARCPICHGVLAVRCRGLLIDLDCLDGCPPGDVERAVAVIS
jgi:hypothetical protein